MAKPLLSVGYIFGLAIALLFVGCQRKPTAATGGACLGCFNGPATFNSQLADWDVAVVARLVQRSPLNALREPQGTFEIFEVLKGRAFVGAGQTMTYGIDSQQFAGDMFLLVSDAQDGLKWSSLAPLSPAAQEYLTKLYRLPNAAERRKFYWQHLAAADRDVADDAQFELEQLKHADLLHLKPHLQHDAIVAQIQNPEITASQLRLYFHLLSICGSEQDLDLLEKIVQSNDRQDKRGLNAAIACYLTLKGAAGLPSIEERFLQDKQANYTDTYSAIMAIRFHLDDAQLIDRDRLLASLRVMLQRPELADLVIPDLAKQQDWSCLEALFNLYKTADTENTWLRVPIINYLLKCPLPRAKEMLKECEQIDPAAMKRAQSFVS
jgi:hypothetical protein